MRIRYTIVILFLSCMMFGQAPQGFTFQGIAMDENNEVLTNHVISLQTSIVESNPSGAVLYSETHSVTSSDRGHFHLLIGKGSNSSSNFNAIDWASNRQYLKIEMDTEGGTDFKHISTSELLSVPYALAAETSLDGIIGPSGIEGPTGPQGLTGPAGPQGPTGSSGPIGPICPAGSSGQTGPQGDPGPAGTNGMSGTQGMQGPQGPVGPPGPAGPQGATGQQGDQGETGTIGDQGPTGDQGPQGFAGPIGPQGPIGEDGPSEGAKGPDGMPGPAGVPGANSFGAPGAQGNDGFFNLQMTSQVPNNVSIYKIYLDDGTNRADSKPGLRYYDGTNWIDLY